MCPAPLTVSKVSAKLVIWFLKKDTHMAERQSMIDGEGGIMNIFGFRNMRSQAHVFAAAVFVAGMIFASMAYADAASAPSGAGPDDVLGAQAGTTSDSSFYGLKRLGEKIRMSLTFDKEDKMKLKYKYAERRLAEAEKLANINKTELAQKALYDYEEDLRDAQAGLARLSLAGRNITGFPEIAANNTYKHIFVLERVYQKVPEHAKSAVKHAIEVSIERHGSLSGRPEGGQLVNITLIINNQTITREVPANLAEKFIDDAREFKEQHGDEVEIENEAELKDAVANLTGVKMSKAREQIWDAREAIAEAEKKAAELAGTNASGAANKLIQEAREHLNRSEQAFYGARLGEAFGQAVSAESLAKNAKKILERHDGEYDEKLKITAKVFGNATRVELELKFISVNATGKEDIAAEILDRLNISREDIHRALKLYAAGDNEEESAEQLEAEAKMERGFVRVDVGFEFSLNSTNSTSVEDGIYRRLSMLQKDEVLAALDFEAKDKKTGRAEEKDRNRKKDDSGR